MTNHYYGGKGQHIELKDDIKEKGLSADDVYDRATCYRRMSSYIDPHKSGNKEKKRLQIPGSGPDKCNIIKEDNGIGRKHK